MCLDDNGALHRLLSLLSLYYAFIIIITIIDNKVWFSFWVVLEDRYSETEEGGMFSSLDAICTGLYLFVIKDPKSFISTTNIVE